MIRSRVGAAAFALAALALAPTLARACDERVLGSCPVQHVTPPSDNVEVSQANRTAGRRASRRASRSARALPRSAGRVRVRFERRKSVRTASQKRRTYSSRSSSSRSSRRRSIGATLAYADARETIGQYSASEREAPPPMPRAAPARPAGARADDTSPPTLTLPLPMNPAAFAASTLTAPPASAEPLMVGSAPSASPPAPSAAPPSAAVRQAEERARREAEREVSAAARVAKADDPADRSTLRTVFIALAGFLALATCARLVLG